MPRLACLLLALPWLNPFSPGPVPSAPPWLFVAAIVATVVISTSAAALSVPRRSGVMAAEGGAVLAIGLFPAQASAFEMLARCGGLVLILLAAILVVERRSVVDDRCPWVLSLAALPWIAAGLLSSVFALLQYTSNAASLVPWINWAPPGEAFANLRQRNQFASLTNMAMAALWAWWIATTPAPTGNSTEAPHPGGVATSLLAAAAITLLTAANAASASRTGLLQLVLLAIVSLAWRRDRRTALWFGWALACYAAGVLLLPALAGLDPSTHGMFARLREGDPVCASRITLWGNVLHLIAIHPWLGWGWGELDFAHYVTLYPGARFCDILDNAHNLPLHLAVELGVPVAVLVCGAIGWAVLRARPWRETDPLRQMAWAVLMLIGLHSLLEYPLWYGPFQMACGLCIGILWRSSAVPTTHRTVPPVAGLTVPMALAALLFAACAYTAWDYRRISQIYLPPDARVPEYRYDTLEKIGASWLFARQVKFADLTTSTVTPANAERLHGLATELLHFSPEARVIEKLLDSAQLLGHVDEVQFHAARYRAAFPEAYAKWAARQPAH